MSITERIDVLWDRPSCEKLDWLELEQLLQDILRSYEPTPALREVDEAIAAFTRRGSVYK